MANYRLADRQDFTIINWLNKIEGPGSVMNSALMANMENEDDPWDWSIDRVVQEFCTANRSWELRSASMALPDPASLEAALRDQEVTGDTLLNEIDDATMRADLGLRTIGQRAFVNHGISALRLRSTKYGAANQLQQPVLSRLMLDELARLIKTSSEGLGGQDDEAAQVEDSLPEAKRQKLDNPHPAADLDHSFANLNDEQGILAPAAASTPVEEFDALNSNGKKKKRIAPTLITSEINNDQIRHMPSAADFVTFDFESALEPEPAPEQEQEPGTIFRDGKGRKRMIPVWQSEASHGPEAGTSSNNALPPAPRGKFSKTDKHIQPYLGRKQMPIDQLFYPDVPVGEELSESHADVEFSMVNTNIPNGQRLYVHNALKRFLRTEPRQFQRLGEVFTAIIPYPSRLTLKYHQQSFTLYSSGSARREYIDSWPEINESDIDSDCQMVDAHTSAFNSTGPGILAQLGRYEEAFDPSYLEHKYKYLEGGDEVLPLYGDSDEDNEYDLQTWKEIEEEQGDLQRTTQITRRSFLSLDEIDQAIDEGFIALVERWTSHKLPKLLSRGYRLWRKSRKEGNKTVRIQIAQEELKVAQRRIARMRKEILEDHWTSKAHVLKQVPIFEVNVFNREELTWRIKLLEQSFCPAKPSTPPPTIEKLITSPHEEEGESINSEDDPSSSEDGLSDFIVEDELLPSTEQELHELNLADTEDSDEMDSDDSSVLNMSNDLQSTPLFLPSPYNASTPIKTETASLPQHRLQNQQSEAYDLTTLSSDDSPVASGVVDLVTPVKSRDPIIIDVSDDEPTLGEHELPSLTDPAAVAKKSYVFWAKVLDRNRLLVTMFFRMEAKMRMSMLQFISNLSQQDLWGHMLTVKEALQDFHSRPKPTRTFQGVKGMDGSTLHILQGYIKLFESYLDCCYYTWGETPDSASINKLIADNERQFATFFELCRTLQDIFELSSQSTDKGKAVNETDSDDSDEDARLPAKGQRSGDSVEFPPASSQKRKRKIYENTEARDRRAQDLRRLQEQEERRRALHANLAKENHGNDEARGRIIINDAAGDDENLIYITPHISSRIKPHQIEGVRFMWNQVVAGLVGEELLQGCLLAHTMGLGKTMQVITLLVSIAEAAVSIDPLISKQIPDRLKQSKTLVLCPAGLVGNWMDEFLIWVPDKILGPLERITAKMTLMERLRKIEEWYDDGGVLILGYEMFRAFVDNKKKALSQEDHELVSKHLLEGPNIIIADEAHKMKNAKSGLHAAAVKFTSSSRIALTGSPLANNVQEYHAMINWVAPNYLGPLIEFKAKYVEPIEVGLWQDSTGGERRRAFKMLKVLNDTLAPKVNRADMSVLRNDLPPKTEFVITVPLTNLQRQLYSFYVTTVASSKVSTTKSGDIQLPTIWLWLAILSLICNHPRCLYKKIKESNLKVKESNSKIKESRRELADGELLALDDDKGIPDLVGQVSKSILPPAFAHEASQLLQDTEDMDSATLSYKVQILCQILDAADAAHDKTLVFSSSIPTLDLLSEIFTEQSRRFVRLDGTTQMSKRQGLTKEFNSGSINIFLISTKAGGLGLNLYGANRVVIFDFGFNPTWEEQAVGRAYRIGQMKPTFVYRLVAGGTFEDLVHNKTIFKKQLANTVVDKKNPIPKASRMRKELVFIPKDVVQEDLTNFDGKDPWVLDRILVTQKTESTIRQIVETDTFEADDVGQKLTAEEERDAERMVKDEHLKRTNLPKWEAAQRKEQKRLHQEAVEQAALQSQQFAAAYYGQHQQQQQPAVVQHSQQYAKSQAQQAQQAQPQIQQSQAVTSQQHTYSLQKTDPLQQSQPLQQVQRTAQSATAGQAIIEAATPNSPAALRTLQSPTPEIEQPVLSLRKETPLQARNESSMLSDSPQSSTGTAKRPNSMEILLQILQSAALSSNNIDISEPKAAESRARSVAFQIKRKIESMYPIQDQRRRAMRGANIALKDDPAQSQALINLTLTPTEFVKNLDAANQRLDSVSADQGPLKTEMFKAMSKQPKPSRQISGAHTTPKPDMRDDVLAMQQLNQKRRAQGMKEVGFGKKDPKIPDWATEKISEARGREGTSRPSTSHFSSHASYHKK